jgi:hypothetical protein
LHDGARTHVGTRLDNKYRTRIHERSIYHVCPLSHSLRNQLFTMRSSAKHIGYQTCFHLLMNMDLIVDSVQQIHSHIHLNLTLHNNLQMKSAPTTN